MHIDYISSHSSWCCYQCRAKKNVQQPRSSSQPSIAGVNRSLFFTCIYRMMDCCTSCKWGLLVINYGEWLGVVASRGDRWDSRASLVAPHSRVQQARIACRRHRWCKSSCCCYLWFQCSLWYSQLHSCFFFSYFSFQFNETLSRVWCLHGLANQSSWSEFRWKMN